MATAQTVIDASVARYKDDDETQWLDAELLSYLNMGVGYVHNLLLKNQSELIQSTATITTVGATQEYALPTGFLAFVQDGVYLSTATRPMTPVKYTEKITNGTTAAAAPTMYYLTSTKIGFIGIPSGASTINVIFYTTKTTLVLATAMPYADLFNDVLSQFMSSMALMRNDEPTNEMIAIYNTLEAAALNLIDRRIPLRPSLTKPTGSN